MTASATALLNRKYETLLRMYHISARIENTASPGGPWQGITETTEGYTITLNTAVIPEAEYETYLAYNVRSLLLPRLTLETERLILRRFQPEDAPACFSFLSDEAACHNSCCKSFTAMDATYEELMALYRQQETRYMIVLKETGQVIGTVNLFEDPRRAVETMELGYDVSAPFRRQGYAYEALSALIALLQTQLQLDLLTAGVLEGNSISIRLLKKLGFHQEGLRHKALFHPTLGPVDLLYFYRDK